MRPAGYETANIKGLDASVLAALRKVQRDRCYPLVFSGPTGTGKTCAAAVFYGTWHRLPMWHRADDLLLSVALGRTGGVEIDTRNEFQETIRVTIPFARFVDRVANCSCLFLDDLGTRTPTEPMYQALFDLMEWRKNKPICVTTNKTIPELAEMFDDRIVSRLAAGTVVLLAGSDRRKRGAIVRA